MLGLGWAHLGATYQEAPAGGPLSSLWDSAVVIRLSKSLWDSAVVIRLSKLLLLLNLES